MGNLPDPISKRDAVASIVGSCAGLIALVMIVWRWMLE
jgi:hypothetical protein